MKTLRTKIFVFVALLIIVPTLPLSYFVLQLLDESYHIGVNERVESALDGALNISSDLYQMHKSHFEQVLNKLALTSPSNPDTIKQQIITSLDSAKVTINALAELDQIESMFYGDVIQDFLKQDQSILTWPSPDHSQLHALLLLNKSNLVQVIYPLPKSFRASAKRILNVNQIYKTLGYVRSDIRKSFLINFLIIYGAVIIISLIVLYRISRTITRPVQQLTAATHQIGSGNLSHRVNIRGQHEFAQLAESFNTMVAELAENQQKILELEKMAAWQQLARRLAHEIKNPLTPIQLMAQQMRDMYAGDDSEYRKMLQQCSEIISDEIESLKRLVREFSDFARLPEFHIEAQPIVPLLESLQQLYHNHTIQLSYPRNDYQMHFDSEYLKRALINLIDNAIAASGPNPEILIQLSESTKSTMLKVMDHGEGIPADKLDKIFEPYFSSKRSGVGLGLPIVKKIVDEHGGTIRVTSVVGEGTTFTLTIPKSVGVSQ